MKVEMKRQKPRGEGIFLIREFSGDTGLIYITDGFVFDFPKMKGSQPLEEATWIEYSSPKLDLEYIS